MGCKKITCYSKSKALEKSPEIFLRVVGKNMGRSKKAKDYSTGGMLMPKRYYNENSYNFGWNTQEKTDEISGSGNHNTALYWEYDTRTERRWNIDPEFRRYPGESSYLVNHGNSIWYSDPLGNDGEKRAREYKAKHGGEIVDLGKGKFSVDRGFKDKDGVFTKEAKLFKDNIFEKIDKGMSRLEDKVDNFMKGSSFLHGSEEAIKGENGQAPKVIKAFIGINPIASVPNAIKVLATGEDIYKMDANTSIDKGLAGAEIIISLVLPGSGIIGKPLIQSTKAAKIIDRVNLGVGVADDLGAFDTIKNKEKKKSNE